MRSSAAGVTGYQTVWAATTRMVLGIGVGVLGACFVLVLPWLSAALLLGFWVWRDRLRRQVGEWAAITRDNEGLTLLSVGMASCVGWTLLLGAPGAALVVMSLLGATPVLVARQRDLDLADAWPGSDRALTAAADPEARLWLVRQRAGYLDDLARHDPDRLDELTRALTGRAPRGGPSR